ncbi:DUF177 domain-containing protein [Aestuariibius sp. HNIBRBA575]|uniref:YceD family protein n=1 Tax=Aestuariibius sp. HNIBRBA575 TaxID=3233343 RepID=UPI0034A4A9EC
MASLPEHLIRIADLPNRAGLDFVIEPDAEGRNAIGVDLDLLGLRKLRFSGRLDPMGSRDWRLVADIGATVVQECVVTLDPVTTRIDEKVERQYVTGYVEPDDSEVEMTDEENLESLPEVLDVAQVMIEALALHLPPYPRKDGAEIGSAVFTEPGQTPMTDEDARPFAGLAALRNSLDKNGENDA